MVGEEQVPAAADFRRCTQASCARQGLIRLKAADGRDACSLTMYCTAVFNLSAVTYIASYSINMIHGGGGGA